MEKRLNKKAQFFILFAVIVSSIIFGLTSLKNYAYSEEENSAVYDISSEIKQESAKVIDYGVYQSEDIQEKIKNFTEKLSVNLADQDPDLEFIFIYGNESSLILENYAKNEATFEIGNNTQLLEGAMSEKESKIIVNLGEQEFDKTQRTRPFLSNSEWWRVKINNPEEKNINLKINNQEYDFKLKQNQQFFMIIKKGGNNQEYVSLK